MTDTKIHDRNGIWDTIVIGEHESIERVAGGGSAFLRDARTKAST